MISQINRDFHAPGEAKTSVLAHPVRRFLQIKTPPLITRNGVSVQSCFMSPPYQRVGIVLSAIPVLSACHLLENLGRILLRSWFIVNLLRVLTPFPKNFRSFIPIFFESSVGFLKRLARS